MPIVSDISLNRGIVEITADVGVVARVRKSHYAKCPTEVGREIDVEAYLDRLAAIQFADGYEAALNSLDVCARSSRDIALSLRRRGYVAPAIDAVIQRLTDNGLIDDADYAKRLAEQQASKPVGVNALRQKLRSKGISESDAEAALEAFDDTQQQAAAQAAAQKLFRKYEALPSREAKRKLSQALARRGFNWDVIESVLDDMID